MGFMKRFDDPTYPTKWYPGGLKNPFAPKPKPTPNFHSIEVNGSKGEIYTVSLYKNGGVSCTCLGFKFRRNCKHSENIKS